MTEGASEGFWREFQGLNINFVQSVFYFGRGEVAPMVASFTSMINTNSDELPK